MTQTNKNQMKKRDITTDTIKRQRVVKSYYDQLYDNELEITEWITVDKTGSVTKSCQTT